MKRLLFFSTLLTATTADEAIRHLQPIGISFSTAFIDYGRYFCKKNNYVRFFCIFAQK